MRGRELMDAVIRDRAKKKDAVVVFEVGVWFGQSVVRWLKVSNKVRVIAIDPFETPRSVWKPLQVLDEKDRKLFGKPDFNRALAEYTITEGVKDAADRTLLITGLHDHDSEFVLQHHKDGTGPDVDVFYLDGAKMPDVDAHVKFLQRTFTGIMKEFPNVVVAGDDWNHDDNEPTRRFQETILEIAKSHERVVFVKEDRTWIMVVKDDERKYKRLGKRVLEPTVKVDAD